MSYNSGSNRIYNKILDRDWFSARLFVTVFLLNNADSSLFVRNYNPGQNSWDKEAITRKNDVFSLSPSPRCNVDARHSSHFKHCLGEHDLGKKIPDISVTALHCYTVVFINKCARPTNKHPAHAQTFFQTYPRMLQGVTYCYTGLHEFTRCYTLLHAVTRCYTVWSTWPTLSLYCSCRSLKL